MPCHVFGVILSMFIQLDERKGWRETGEMVSHVYVGEVER